MGLLTLPSRWVWMMRRQSMLSRRHSISRLLWRQHGQVGTSTFPLTGPSSNMLQVTLPVGLELEHINSILRLRSYNDEMAIDYTSASNYLCVRTIWRRWRRTDQCKWWWKQWSYNPCDCNRYDCRCVH